MRINCDPRPDRWDVTLHPLNGLPIKLLAALQCIVIWGEPVAHVLSADLVKHNRGGFKGDQGGGGGTKGGQRGDMDWVQAGLAERQVGTEEFLRAARRRDLRKQAENKQCLMSDMDGDSSVLGSFKLQPIFIRV